MCTHRYAYHTAHNPPTWVSKVELLSMMSLGKARRTNVAAPHHMKHSHFNTGLSRARTQESKQRDSEDTQIIPQNKSNSLPELISI